MIAELAERQHGVVASRQLTALGMGEKGTRHRTATGRLHPIHRGVHAVGWPGLSRHGRWMAAVLAAGPLAVLSHRSAACLWRMVDQAPGLVHVTVPHGVQPRGDFRLHRTRSLAEDDRRIHEAIPVTSPTRTVIDLCSVLALRDLELAVEKAIRLELFDAAVLPAARLRHTGRKGLRKLDALLGPAADAQGTRSRLEVRLKRFSREHGLPPPETNVQLCGFEVDALWREEHVVAEADSFEFHSSRAAFERDRRRDSALAAAGYRVVRITSRRMREDGPRLAAEIRRLLSPLRSS